MCKLVGFLICLLFFAQILPILGLAFFLLGSPTLQGLLSVTDGELKDVGIEDAAHRETILTQLSRQRHRLDPHSGNTRKKQADEHAKRRAGR